MKQPPLVNFSIETDQEGVAVVTFNCVDRSMNTISNSVLDDLDILVDRIERDANIRGVVLRSGKANGFCAGADLGEMELKIADWRRAKTPAEMAAGREAARLFNRRFRALEVCGKPITLALEGLALGGGLELALACHFRVAAAQAKLRLAFPEATIGLLPGAGGTQRLPRLMGVERALPHLLEGIPITPQDALDGGILHAIVSDDELMETCRRYILEGGSAIAPWDTAAFALPHGDGSNPYLTARIALGRGDRYPAEANILRAVAGGATLPMDAALDLESACFFDAARTPQAAAMVKTLFHARQAMGKTGRPDYADALVAALKNAWEEAATRQVAAGVSRAALGAAAGRIDGWSVPDAPVSHLDISPSSLSEIESALLRATAAAAQAFVRDHGIADTAIADLVAVDAGFPAWTGGPISYANWSD